MAADQVTLPEGFEVQQQPATVNPPPPPGFDVQPGVGDRLKAAAARSPAFQIGEAGLNIVTGLGMGFPAYLERGVLGIGEEGRGPETPAPTGAQPAGFAAAVRSARARREQRSAEVAAIEAMGRPVIKTQAELASQEATYSPITPGGQRVAQTLLTPISKLNEQAEKKGHEVTDATGSPVLGALTEATISMAPAVLLPMLRAGVKGVTADSFRNAATVLDGKPAPAGEPSPTEAKLQKIYVETGNTPAQTIKAALEDTNTMADLVAENRDIPPAILEKGEAVQTPEQPGGQGAPAGEQPPAVRTPIPAPEELLARPTHPGDTIEMPPSDQVQGAEIPPGEQPSAFEAAARDQIDFLNREANARGLENADELLAKEPAEFDRLAREWRARHEAQPHITIPLGENLGPEQRVVEAKARAQVEADLEGNLKAYADLPDSEGGKIINTDLARELFPDYQKNRSIHSPSVHEPASTLMKELYLRRLSEPDPNGLNMVTFTAGGTGAGKSTAIGSVPLVSEIKNASQIVYDTNMNTFKSSIAKIDLALQHGKQANIIYVGADPVDALGRALARAMRTGRTVPLNEHAKTHVGSADTLTQMMEYYKGNVRVQFIVLDNSSNAKGEVGIIELKDAKKYIKTLNFEDLPQRLQEKLDAERNAGNISEEVYRGTAAAGPEGASAADRAGGQAQPGTGGQGGQETAQLREEIGGKGQKVQPGEKFIVYRLGRNANLANRNAGNADAIARYIMGTEDFESPISSKAGKVFAYEVTLEKPFGKYEGLEGGRAGKNDAPGRTTRGREVSYSFPKEGYSSRLIGSRTLKQLRQHLKGLGVESADEPGASPTFDDAGSKTGGQAIRESFAKGEGFDLGNVPASKQPAAMGDEIGRQLREMGASDEEATAASKAWEDTLTAAAERHDTTPAKLLADPQELARDPEIPPEIRQALERMPPGSTLGRYAPLAQRGGPPIPQQLPPRTPSETAVLERISKDPAAKRGYSWEEFYADVKDDLFPIKRLTDELRAGGTLGTAEDPYKLARLTRGAYGKAEQFLEYSPFDFKTYQNVGKSMREIIEPVKHDLDGLRAYALSKRAIELEARGIETGVPLDSAKQVVADGDRYAQVLKELHEYQDHLTAYLKDAGILSAEGVKAMREANKEYVPFFRLMDDAEGAASAGTGLKVHQPVKKIRGSERKIIDPLESIVKNTYLYTTLAERNAVGEALVSLAERAGRDDLVKEITPPVRPIKIQDEEVRRFLKENGIDADKDFEEAMTVFRRGNLTPAEDEIVVFREGKRKLYQVPEEVATAFKATDRETAGMLTRVLAIPAKLLRVGATLSPDFISRNPVRDQFSAYVLSKSGYVPILDMARGVASIAKHDADFQNWLKSGGANSALVSLDRDYVQQELARRSGDLGFADKAWNIVKNPLEPLRIASELMENATRVGEFKKAAGGNVSKEAILSAGYEAREVTLDFARIGARTRALNLITAFWNANLEGIDRVVRAMNDRPLETTIKIATSITLPSVLLWAANHDDDWVDPQGNHHNRWKETPNWERDLFWIVLTKDHIYRIPKPFELGVLFGSTFERLLDKLVDDKPDATKDLASSLVSTMGINMVPTIASPVLGQMTNWNFFTDRPLIPGAQEKLLPEYQYSSYTTQTTRALGHLIGMIPGMHDKSMASPQVIDNYIRSWTGTLGNYTLQIADAALRKTGVVPDPVRPAKTLEDMPVLRGFMVRYPSSSAQSIQDFYDAYDKSKKVTDTIRHLVQQGDVKAAFQEMRIDQEKMVRIEGVHQGLAKAQQVLQLIDQNKSFDADQKRQLIDTIYYQMILMARAGNQGLRELTKAIGKPPTHMPEQKQTTLPEGFEVVH